MEFIKKLDSLLKKEFEEARQLNVACVELNGHILKEVEYLNRLDIAATIDGLKSRLLAEVRQLKHEEDISEHGFDVYKSFNSVVGFAFGSIVGAMNKQNPLMSGFRSFNTELDKRAEFGNVKVAIKEEDETADIKIVSVSRLARESRITEVEVMSSLQEQGYSLISPEDFWEVLHYARESIINGESR